MIQAGAAVPQVIYLIRHGEKPDASGKPPLGVDPDGRHDVHSLTPRGWQRAGALATLFGTARPELARPDHLVAPDYGGPKQSALHRANQTLSALAQKLGLQLEEPYAVGDEAKLATHLTGRPGVTLVAWEHQHIPDIARHLPLAPGTVLPQAWPDDRFDVVWRFERDLSAPDLRYRFSQVPQLLLGGDRAAVIAPARAGVALDL